MRRSRAAQKTTSLNRPKLYKVSEEVKEWAAMLAGELATWPGVRSKPMFGLVSFYRNDKIFAALPRTRALTSPRSIIFKFHAENAATRKARQQLQDYPAGRWLSFELHSASDLTVALRWLDLAYRMAK
jgi:hypothetical protein